MAGETDAFVLLILACIFPPAAAAFVTGCGADLCLNILLTMLGYLPGCIHAFWLVIRRAEANERYGYKNWIYTGMGEYVPNDEGIHTGRYSSSYGQAQAPPPPPPGQYPAGKPPVPSQAPVDQKPGGYGYAPQSPIDQKWSGYVPPPAPAEQKYGGYQALPQTSADQKAINVPPEAADQKPADSTAQYTVPPSGT